MDVLGVLRRLRLPLVVSLFLAALLGGPASAGHLADPLPAPVTSVRLVAVADPAPAAAPSAPAVAETPVEVSPVVPAEAVTDTAPLLTTQVSAAAAAPRAPPFSA